MAATDRPLLAVCIPTHHGRAGALSELLDRLLPQLPRDGSVEVCISDNASEDETAEMVAARRYEHELVRYSRNERDLGLAGNLFAVVEMARADYCWLLGSDDAPAPGGVAELVAQLRANPGVSGAHLGFLRRRADDLDAPAQDWPPDVMPAPGPLRVRSESEYVEQLGMLPLTLSLNVVHRERWLEIAAAERRRAERTPIHPHVYVVGRVAQRWPDWLWAEAPVVLLRQAAYYLAADADAELEKSDLGRELRAMTADVSRVWANLHGRRSPLRRALLGRFGRWVMHPAAAAWRKLASARRLRDDLLYLGFARHFWRSREFRRKTLPLLLTPSARMAVPDCDQDGEPDDHDRRRARLTGAGTGRFVELAETPLTGRGAWVEVFVHNDTDRTLSFTEPHYAALYALWVDSASGEQLDLQTYVTPLYPPVRPGRVRRLEQLVSVPEPGSYRLFIDLFDRRSGTTMTGGEPLIADVEVGSRARFASTSGRLADAAEEASGI
ncbi:MAG TPA: glycosyltransferase family A protein [Solirubrobacterales bacterium]|nr:glycosyltransferase family A protein [Solirubrobacterales bacterium]